MRSKLLFVLGLFLVLAVLASPVAAITWGEPDTKHTNVGAMVNDYPDYGLWQSCTGTLISPRVFLTAGHCVEDLDVTALPTFVNFDQDALNAGTLLAVQAAIPHPDYYWGPNSNPYDVGVLILAEPVTDIVPANLPKEGFLDQLLADGLLNQGQEKAKFTLVGYGGSLDWPPPDIYYEDTRQVAYSEYRTLLKVWLKMSQNQATGDGGTCYGDSGGPAFWEDPVTKVETIVGVTSWGDAQCVASAFNYRVDIAETLTFIQDVFDSLD